MQEAGARILAGVWLPVQVKLTTGTNMECITYTLPVNKPSGGEEWFEPPLVDTSLHTMYHHQIEEVTHIWRSYQWLEKAGL